MPTLHRALALALLALGVGACATAPCAALRDATTMPVEAPTDTLRVDLSRVAFEGGVLRAEGRVVARGPQTAGWVGATGARVALAPPPFEGPMLPDTVRAPYAVLNAGLDGAFEIGVVTPSAEGYRLEAQWVGAFGRTLRVDSLLAAAR